MIIKSINHTNKLLHFYYSGEKKKKEGNDIGIYPLFIKNSLNKLSESIMLVNIDRENTKKKPEEGNCFVKEKGIPFKYVSSFCVHPLYCQYFLCFSFFYT